jgi:hypothetical protein
MSHVLVKKTARFYVLVKKVALAIEGGAGVQGRH